MASLLANILLIFHFLYVSYIVFGFGYIWLGFFLKWSSIRNPVFRWTHLAAMGIVILETALNIFCPLTEWEAELRGMAGQTMAYPEGFIPYWTHQILYYDWPVWVFQTMYILFFLIMILTLLMIPPKRKTTAGETG